MLLKFGEETVVVSIGIVREVKQLLNRGILRLKKDLALEDPSEQATGRATKIANGRNHPVAQIILRLEGIAIRVRRFPIRRERVQTDRRTARWKVCRRIE